MNLKDKLSSALGVFGFILFYVLSVLFVCIPIVATDLPSWIQWLILAVIIFTDLVGSLVSIAVFVYATIVVLSSPFTWFSVVFFVDTAVYFIFFLIPSMRQFYCVFKERRERE